VAGLDFDFDLKGNFTSITIFTFTSEPPKLSGYWSVKCWEIEFVGSVPIIDSRQNLYPINRKDQKGFEGEP